METLNGIDQIYYKNLSNKYIGEFFESTFLYFQKTFMSLNINKFELDIKVNEDFDIYFAYSYDAINYSEFKLQKDYGNEIIDSDNKLYVAIYLRRKIHHDLYTPKSLFDSPPTDDKYEGGGAKLRNVDFPKQYILIDTIKYNPKDKPKYLEVFCRYDFKQQQNFDLINEFPKWNFHDNQQINIQRWLDTCNTMAEMYGHTAIYFKTESVEHQTKNPNSGIHGTHHVLQNNVIRNVTSIKRLHIVAPSNELPQDRNIFTEWDMPLQDDFIIHIVRQKFEQAFGLKTVPNEKDFIYLPIINKLFRVSTMQPKNGFMGVIGWYEVFLAKFEDDECVTMNDDLKNTISDVPGLFDEVTGDNEMIDEDLSVLNDEFQDYLVDTVETKDKVNQKTIEEEKEATFNYSNRLEDNSFLVSLKETETLRENYDKRLEILSINPDDSLFPITMYDFTKIEKRTIALTYQLSEYSKTNKFSNISTDKYLMSFNFVLRNRFSGELFDLLSDFNTLITTKINSKKLSLFDTSCQETFTVDYVFDIDEFYQVNIGYNIKLGQYSIHIFVVNNGQKSLQYQNIYKLSKDKSLLKPQKINSIYFFGGKYFMNDINFVIDNRKFIDDKCLPLLDMYKF